MQPHHYAIGAGILWLATLTVLPYLFATARRRAFDRGLEAGKTQHKADLTLQIKGLKNELDEARIDVEAGQRKHHLAVAALKRTIGELEERIMSYTGMPVTRTDYDLLISAAETLRLAEKTWKAAPGTEPWRNRATQQMQDIQALAMRIHSQLRSTPASAASVEAAA